jgi:hypothetical protein
MDMEHIKPTTTLTLHPILYSPTHLFMSFIDRHILMLLQHTYHCNRLITKGTEEPYRNEILIQKLCSYIWQKSYVKATVRSSDCNKARHESNERK